MKARSDSWYAMLTEEQLWQLYSMAKRHPWFEVADVAVKEYGLSKAPGRTAYYCWLDWMRGQEMDRRLAQARIAAMEANDLAGVYGLKDEKAIAAYKSLAAEFALKSDAKSAEKFMQLAMGLRDRQLKAAELELKSREASRRDEELKIAQKKLEIEQAKNAKAVEAVEDATITDEERVAKIKGIFGIK